MTLPTVRIDIVSDVVCPWCVIGLGSLDRAVERVSDAVAVDIAFHPFELNPDMPPEGENVAEHIGRKYGAPPEQMAANRARIRDSAAAIGFAMNTGPDSRIYNTFDAHRLLHWAAGEGRQRALKERLFRLYFTEGGNPSDTEQLVAAAMDAGLDGDAARDVLTSGRYADDVRAEEQQWRMEGITAVPAFIFNRKYLVMGGQPPEAFERALRKIAAEE
jgi:predicted DsbA family dithiol-disulfide isomerase